MGRLLMTFLTLPRAGSALLLLNCFPVAVLPQSPTGLPPQRKSWGERGTPPPNSVIPLGTLDQRKDGRRYWGKVQGIHEPIHKVSGYFKKLSSPIASIVFSEKGSHRTENPVRS